MLRSYTDSSLLSINLSLALVLYFRFFVYNALSKNVVVQEMIPYKLLRNAGIGFVASIISDTVVNAIRVVKTAKQAMGSKYSVSYLEIINGIVAADGWRVRKRFAKEW